MLNRLLFARLWNGGPGTRVIPDSCDVDWMWKSIGVKESKLFNSCIDACKKKKKKKITNERTMNTI